MTNKRKFTAKKMIGAIQKAKGVKSGAAKILGCSRHTVDNYIRDMPTVRAAYLEEVGKLYDLSYVAMADLVSQRHWPAVRYAQDNYDPEVILRRMIGDSQEDAEIIHEEEVVDEEGQTAVTLRIVRDR